MFEIKKIPVLQWPVLWMEGINQKSVVCCIFLGGGGTDGQSYWKHFHLRRRHVLGGACRHLFFCSLLCEQKNVSLVIQYKYVRCNISDSDLLIGMFLVQTLLEHLWYVINWYWSDVQMSVM